MAARWTQQLLDLVPLSASHWAIAAGIAATAVLVNEGHKWLRPRPRSER